MKKTMQSRRIDHKTQITTTGDGKMLNNVAENGLFVAGSVVMTTWHIQ